MSVKIVDVLNFESMREILREDQPVHEIVEALFQKGTELAQVVSSRGYDNFDEFQEAHRADETQLAELEGPSNLEDRDVVVLRSCPMAEEMKKFRTTGAPPSFHAKIVEEFCAQNPGSNAILHPGCIAHQVGRQITIKQLNVRGESNLNFNQIACRNMATGQVVYDDNGLEAIGMTKEQANSLVDGFACLYAIIHRQN
jgi:hypothetical protein